MSQNPFDVRLNFLASIRQINIDEDQYQVKDAMGQIAKANLKRIRCEQVCKLLRVLLTRSIGTNEVENNIKRTFGMCTKVYQQCAKKKVMRAKLADAHRKREEAKQEYHNTVNEKRPAIPDNTWNEFVVKCRRYIPKYRRVYKKKHCMKIEWLTRKYGEIRRIPPDEVNGVDLRDQELGTEFNSEPRQYGDVALNDDENSVLSLPPKFGITKKVDVTETTIEVEKCLNTMRWKEIIGEETVSAEFYNEETKEMDINQLKPTDLPFNAKVCMPKPSSLEREIVFQKLKNDIKEIATDMNKRTKDGCNLLENEKRGLKALKDRKKEEEIVCFQTDKSGRWAVDTVTNYTNSTEQHIQRGVREITLEEYNNSEEQLNCNAKALLRMMGLKEDYNGTRVRQACTANGINFAELYSLRKDHKPVREGEEALGPKSRPVCGCRDCGAKRVSYLLCQILRPLVSESETQCDSTETLLYGFKELNDDEDVEIPERWIIGSLDIEALYPSLDIDVCAAITNMILFNSGIQFKDLQWKEIVLYLRYMLTDEQVRGKRLAEYTPERRTRRGVQRQFVTIVLRILLRS